MPTATSQHKIDLFINKIILRFLPKFLTPNILTIIRLLLVPVVYLLLLNGYVLSGFIVFIIAAITDALDGAMARTQNKISDFGKLMDPIADKLLIGSVLFYIGFEYTIIKIFLVVILFEIFSVVISALMYHKIGRPIGANVYGKIKMVLQTIAIVIFLTGILTDATILILISEWVLFVALFFALISGLEQMRRKLHKNITRN